jgi:hypothetical protein
MLRQPWTIVRLRQTGQVGATRRSNTGLDISSLSIRPPRSVRYRGRRLVTYARGHF